MGQEPADIHIIERAQRGDMTAFRTIVERHERRVAGVVKRMLGDSPEAADVGQEVFIRLYESLEKFRGESSLATYVTRIAINLSLNELKRRKRKLTRFGSLDEAEEVNHDEPSDDLKEILHREIQRLEPDYKLVVTLRMIEGYSVEETASILNVPVGTVMSRLYRAQKRLKEIISTKEGL